MHGPVSDVAVLLDGMVYLGRVAVDGEVVEHDARIQEAVDVAVRVEDQSDACEVTPNQFDVSIDLPRFLQPLAKTVRRLGSGLYRLGSRDVRRSNNGAVKNGTDDLGERLVTGEMESFVFVEFHYHLLRSIGSD